MYAVLKVHKFKTVGLTVFFCQNLYKIKLVLEKVPGATEQNVKIKLEYDDGYYKYDGDIIYEQKEYDFEIDAYSGEFLEWSEEKL